jgi:squalene synthase HpnC
MRVEHYENFPVASALLPPHLREAVVDIYRFARTADDIADEGNASDTERLAALAQYDAALHAMEQAQGSTRLPAPEPAAIFGPLAKTIARHHLPVEPFRRLLAAFRQDVAVNRYGDFDALLRYCAMSANPVGELMLHLFDALTPVHLKQSDAICTGLQLTNFWQDVAIDAAKGRLYLPLSDMARFGVDAHDLAGQAHSQAWRELMRFQVERARGLLLAGAPLALDIPGRTGWELRLVVCGGLRILERLDAVQYDVFRARPTLGRRDWLALGRRALNYRSATRITPPTT